MEARKESCMEDHNLFEVPPSLIDIIFLLLIFSLVLLASGLLSGHREKGKIQKENVPVFSHAKSANPEDQFKGLIIRLKEDPSKGDSILCAILGEYRPGVYLTSIDQSKVWRDTLRDKNGNYLINKFGRYEINPNRKRFFYFRWRYGKPSPKMKYVRNEIRALLRFYRHNMDKFSLKISANKTIPYGVIADIMAQCNPDTIKFIRLIGVKKE